MAVKNVELIALACEMNNVHEVVKTLPQWNQAGYKIKAGSKALFKTQIWKPCKKTVKDDDGKEIETTKMRLVDAYFFGLSQVVKAN